MIATFESLEVAFGRWRDAARRALASNLTPSDVEWSAEGSYNSLFGAGIATSAAAKVTVPKRFLSLARSVGSHSDTERWALLYTLLWRLAHGDPYLLDVTSDPLVHRLLRMHRAVRRETHKMKAFVRFRAIVTGRGEEFVAWFEPAHPVLERALPFFVDRFPSMRWAILTPAACAHWNGEALSLTAGIERHLAPSSDDALESLWCTYYAGIFNPARLNRPAMLAEMPMRYWKNLPEAALIASLSRGARARVVTMIAQTFAEPVPLPSDLDALESARPASPPPTHEAWHPTGDPGWRVAKERGNRIPARWPQGLRCGGAHVLAGVAGWTDPSILAEGVFYPTGATSAEARLRYYATQLPLVEVDATYYALPGEDTSRRWVERTPDGFTFDIKAHSLMTGHPTDVARLPAWLKDTLTPRLRAATNVYTHHFPTDVIDEVWRRFLHAISPLREAGRLGAIMLQYPKWFTPTRASGKALEQARDRLGDCPAAIEVRHREWMDAQYSERYFALLRTLSFAHVVVDAPPGMESSVPFTPRVTNDDLAIFRFHGRRVATWEARNEDVAERYRYLYDANEMAAWLPALERAVDQARRVHLVFNNNKWNYAAINAIEMNYRLGRTNPWLIDQQRPLWCLDAS